MLLGCISIASTPYMGYHVMATTFNRHWCVGIDLHKDALIACTFCRCCGELSYHKIACKCRK